MKESILEVKEEALKVAEKIEESGKKKRVRNTDSKGIWHIIGLLSTIFAPLYLYASMEIFYFGSILRFGWYFLKFPGARIFTLLMLYAIYLILWLVVKKGFIASLVMFVSGFFLATANYFKYSLTGDFVYPWDIVNQKGNVGELLSFLKIGLPVQHILLIVVAIALLAVIYLSKTQIKLRFGMRFGLAVLIVVLGYLPFRSSECITKTLTVFNMMRESTITQENNHIEHGFTGGFIVNALSMSVNVPEGYSDEKAKEILSAYDDKEAVAGYNSPDIIVILSESFWDPKLLPNTTFSENPIKNFEEIAMRKNARSGYMYETAMGGGTVRTEFEVLTGLTVEQLPVGSVPWQYVSYEIPTYPSHYKENGYRTVAMHTYMSSFYFRKNTYPYIGFDEMYFQDELTQIDEVNCTMKGGYISDNSFADYVMHLMDMDDSKPCFLFGISMENHQPYENKFEKLEVEVGNPNLSDAALNSLQNYTTGVRDSDLALKKIVDYIDARERDTLLVYFGDHIPTLGANSAAYVESGFIKRAAGLDKEDVRKTLRVPFLIYGNFDFAETDMTEQGVENKISAYNLLNVATELAGAPKTAYMEFLSDYYEEAPFYNDRISVPMTEQLEEFVSAHRILTYDVLVGKNYSKMK